MFWCQQCLPRATLINKIILMYVADHHTHTILHLYFAHCTCITQLLIHWRVTYKHNSKTACVVMSIFLSQTCKQSLKHIGRQHLNNHGDDPFELLKIQQSIVAWEMLNYIMHHTTTAIGHTTRIWTSYFINECINIVHFIETIL